MMASKACWLLFLLGLLSTAAPGADQIPEDKFQPVAIEFSGYHFGQSPAANMVCFSGYCK
jgi:hypothetical protein